MLTIKSGETLPEAAQPQAHTGNGAHVDGQAQLNNNLNASTKQHNRDPGGNSTRPPDAAQPA